MKKIASPQELQAGIQQILAYCQGPDLPSRVKVAEELQGLADRVASRDDWYSRFQACQAKFLNDTIKALKKELKDRVKVVKVADKGGAEFTVDKVACYLFFPGNSIERLVLKTPLDDKSIGGVVSHRPETLATYMVNTIFKQDIWEKR